MIFNTLFSALPGYLPVMALTVLAFLPGVYAALVFNVDNSRRYAYLPVSNRTSFPYTIF